MNKIKNITLIILTIIVITLSYYLFQSLRQNTPPESAFETTEVVVFFNKVGETECDKVYPTRREIEGTNQIIEKTIYSLLEGPTEEEQKQGYITNIPEGVILLNYEIKNGFAIVDFSGELNNAAGSCRVQAIRAQITQTLMQFENIQEVTITVMGESEGILQP